MSKNHRDDGDPDDDLPNEEDELGNYWDEKKAITETQLCEPFPEESLENTILLLSALENPNPFVNEDDPEHIKLILAGYIWIGNSLSLSQNIADAKAQLNARHSKGPFFEIVSNESAYDSRGIKLKKYVSLWGKRMDS